MSVEEAALEALRMLNDVEIRGERNIACMVRAIELVKAIVNFLDHPQGKEVTARDGQDEQG